MAISCCAVSIVYDLDIDNNFIVTIAIYKYQLFIYWTIIIICTIS